MKITANENMLQTFR